jgi:hypothetical protein
MQNGRQFSGSDDNLASLGLTPRTDRSARSSRGWGTARSGVSDTSDSESAVFHTPRVSDNDNDGSDWSRHAGSAFGGPASHRSYIGANNGGAVAVARGLSGSPVPTPAPVASVAVDGLVADLFRSTRHGHYKEVERIMQLSVDVDVCDQHGNTFLLNACQNGNKRIAKISLRMGGDIDAVNNRGNTALHYCFAFGYFELGSYLISKGARVDVLNDDGLVCSQGLNSDKPLADGAAQQAVAAIDQGLAAFDGQ